MKLLLTLLFCSALSAFSQGLDLIIKIQDESNGKFLSDVKMTLGDHIAFGYDYAGSYASAANAIDRDNLTDTLFIQLEGYSFEIKPLIEHNYSIETIDGKVEYLLLHLYGVPHMRNYKLEVPIAKSKKSNYDSVALQLYVERFSEETTLRLMNLNGEEIVVIKQQWKGKNHIEQYIPYADLEDGYFERESNGIIKRYPFIKMDWLSPIYLGDFYVNRDRELEAMRTLIDNRKAHIADIEALNWLHKLAVYRYEAIIDSLETEIYILKNGPIDDYPEEVPEFLEEEQEVAYFFVKDELAQPTIGVEAFLAGLKEVLMEHKVKKSGFAQVNFVISKWGGTNFIVSRYEPHITAAITEYLNGINWNTQMINGKNEHAYVKLYLHFVKE